MTSHHVLQRQQLCSVHTVWFYLGTCKQFRYNWGRTHTKLLSKLFFFQSWRRVVPHTPAHNIIYTPYLRMSRLQQGAYPERSSVCVLSAFINTMLCSFNGPSSLQWVFKGCCGLLVLFSTGSVHSRYFNLSY